jgi:hypothetical protein
MDATEAVRRAFPDWPRPVKPPGVDFYEWRVESAVHPGQPPRFESVIRHLDVHDNLAHPTLEPHPTLRAYRMLEARAISREPKWLMLPKADGLARAVTRTMLPKADGLARAVTRTMLPKADGLARAVTRTKPVVRGSQGEEARKR